MLKEPIQIEEPVRAPHTDANRWGWQRFAGPATYLAVVAVQLIVIWPIANTRVFDGDEGFYAIAAKLVSHGKEPYFDFWFQHAPLLPYVYGAWTRLTGESFQNLRNLSVVLTVALGVILYAHVAHRFSRRLGMVATVLYITSGWVFGWYSTYKSYALSTLLLFVAYVLVAAADRSTTPSTTRWFAAGILVGLSVDVRLFFIAVVPVFAYYTIDRNRSHAARYTNIPVLAGGLVVGLLPSLFFFVRDSRRFLSDTLLSQTSRSDTSLLDSLVQKLRTLEGVFENAQFLVLIGAAVAVAIIAFVTHRRLPLAIAVAAALAVVSLIPTPTYDQYFVTDCAVPRRRECRVLAHAPDRAAPVTGSATRPHRPHRRNPGAAALRGCRRRSLRLLHELERGVRTGRPEDLRRDQHAHPRGRPSSLSLRSICTRPTPNCCRPGEQLRGPASQPT